MSQPEWRFVANLGDVDPLEHGGYFLYEDATGVYGFEAEKVDREGLKVQIWRVCLDRLKEVRDEEDNRLYLVPFRYDKTWTHPVHMYEEWFTRDLSHVADYVGATTSELRECLCSEDGVERARAYRAIYDYHGWCNGDSEPMTLSLREAKKRYRRELASSSQTALTRKDST